MPIRVQDELPAVNFLRSENVFVMTTTRATTQEIRPLKVLILNLMPKKIETENQFLRLLSNSPLQLDIQLLRIDARESRNTPSEHLNNFYCNFDDICDQNFDGLIVTGAPLGLVEFNDVAYWPQIKQVLEWSKDHVTSTLFVCWAVQAALNILYGIPKQTRTEKLSGVYEHHLVQPHALLTRGFDDSFLAPHSRYADFPAQLIRDYTDLDILAETEAGDAYLFDVEAGLNPDVPYNYFPKNDPQNKPRATWRSHGNLLFTNWLNYYVYQITPYDLRHMNPTLE
mgnify:CR=1 FL=1